MSYLLRTPENYKICYGEPVESFVITKVGYFAADEFQEMVDEEREVECHDMLQSDNFPLNGWADVAQNDRGIVIPDIVADYLLGCENLEIDSWVEINSPVDTRSAYDKLNDEKGDLQAKYEAVCLELEAAQGEIDAA